MIQSEKMIQFEEFMYLVKYAIDFFKRRSEKNNKYMYYEDVAWDYARGVLGNTLDENEKKDLYLKLIIKLNKKYQICFPDIIYDSIDNGNVPDEKSEAILLFLMDWNGERFLNQVNLDELKNYINKTLERIHIILQNIGNMFNKSNEEVFKEVRDKISVKINILTGKRELEHVSTAKILMLINPDRFIAWDNKIANKFELSRNNPIDYKRFNDSIDDFLNRFGEYENIQNNAKKYMEEKGYINKDSHKIRKLLDMIFWIAYSINNNSDQKFRNYMRSLRDSINIR